MFKLVKPIDNIQLDNPETLCKLREEYPSCYFKTGQYKNETVLFILGDLTTRVYAEPRKLKDNSTYFGPADMSKFDLEQYEVAKDQRQFKIKVDLLNKTSIWVKPATLEPQAYSLIDDEDDTPYSQATEYGRLAYALYDDLSNNKDLLFTDERVKTFIRLICDNSYALPRVIFSNLNLITRSDLMNIVSAGLGISEDLLEVKKNT